MRLLADENFPGSIVERLRDGGHDVLWGRTDCPGLKDSLVLQLAEAEERILLTLDKDFWQLAVQRRVPLAELTDSSARNGQSPVWGDAYLRLGKERDVK